MFVTAIHAGKPAILDTVANVYTTGFDNWTQAVQKASELNKAPQKKSKLTRIGKGF